MKNTHSSYFSLKSFLTAVCICIVFAGTVKVSDALTGTINNASFSQSLVCHDPGCTPALAGKMNWKPTLGAGITAVSIDDTTGLSGDVWGNEIGWVNLKPTGQGVVVNQTTGILTGYAWSSTCGWMNFSPTSYGVSIVTETAESGASGTGVGKLSGFAWCGGENGGWIQFDCSVASNAACVKTNWVKQADRYVAPSGGGGGGGGGGGFVALPATSTPTTATQIADDSKYTSQTGSQSQKNGDYSGLYRADVDDSGTVGILDFNLIMVNWGKKQTVNLSQAKPDRCKTVNVADLNCDGKVDVLDFNVLMINWGKKVTATQ